jgi:replicative DNA helicase
VIKVAAPNESRPLPKNREAEQVVLGCAIVEAEGVMPLLLEKLRSEHFYFRTHRLIYQTLVGMFERGEPIDLITVGNRLEEKGVLPDVGGRSYLSELVASVTTTTSVSYYADIVLKKALLRDLVQAGYDIAELGFREDEELSKLLDLAEERVFRVSRQTLKQSYHAIGEILHEHLDLLEKLQEKQEGVTGLPSGFKELDKRTAGFHPADLIIVAGRPSMGKSSFALSIARNVALHQEKSVGIFSLEMTKEQLIERLLCAEARVNLLRLRGGYLGADSEAWRRIMLAASRLQKARILIDDTPGISVMELKAKARRMKAEHGLDLLIVDYLQLVEGGARVEVREQEISYIARSLKGLARELNVPVLACSQLSRAVERRDSKRPRLSDLRECLTGDTVIYHAITGRPYTIRELYERRLLIPVHTVTPELKLGVTLPAHVVQSGIKPVFRLRTRTGRVIRASANHPFLTVAGWRKLEQLRPGDRIAAPRRLPLLSKGELAEDEARLLGYLIADGSYRRHGAVSLSNADPEVIEDAAQIVQRRFSIPARPKPHWSGTLQVEFSVPRGYGPGRNPLVNWLKLLGIHGETTTEKRIPQVVFEAPPEVIAAFLGGLWAGDGSVFYRSKYRSWSLKYTSTSMELLRGVHHLLTRLGIVSILERKTRHTKSTVDIASLRVDGRVAIRRFARLIPIAGKKGRKLQRAGLWAQASRSNEQIDRFPLSVTERVAALKETQGLSWQALSYRCQGKTMSRTYLRKVAAKLEDPFLEYLAASDLLWDPIVSIELDGEEMTYDLVVPGTHNFIANDLVVHNSGEIEQTADVVLFLYRPDYYDDPKGEEAELDLAGEKRDANVSETEIIIGKQRNGPTDSFTLIFHKVYASFYEFLPSEAVAESSTPPF